MRQLSLNPKGVSTMDKIERTPEEELDDIIDALNAGKKPVSAGKEVSELLPALSRCATWRSRPCPQKNWQRECAGLSRTTK